MIKHLKLRGKCRVGGSRSSMVSEVVGMDCSHGEYRRVSRPNVNRGPTWLVGLWFQIYVHNKLPDYSFMKHTSTGKKNWVWTNLSNLSPPNYSSLCILYLNPNFRDKKTDALNRLNNLLKITLLMVGLSEI